MPRPGKTDEEPAEPAISESCPNVGVDDNDVRAYISDAIHYANVPSGGLDVEMAFRYLQRERCLPEYCRDQDLAAAEHFFFARYMVFVEGMPGPAIKELLLGEAREA